LAAAIFLAGFITRSTVGAGPQRLINSRRTLFAAALLALVGFLREPAGSRDSVVSHDTLRDL